MAWKLRIVSNSIRKKQSLVFDVDRETSAAGDLELYCEISFLNPDDFSTLFKETYSHLYQNGNETLNCYVPQNLIYARKKDEFILPKVLLIRCRMFQSKGSLLKSEQCFARTRIRVERMAYTGIIYKFSTLALGEKRYLLIKSASTEKQLETVKLSLGDDLCCKEKLWIQINAIKNDYIKFCICEVFLVDSEGKKVECGKSKFLFIEEERNEWKFPLYFTKSYLMAKKKQFLLSDTLTLKCEFEFSTGIEYQRIEDSEFGNLAVVIKDSPKFSSALEDLARLYDEGILCDVTLQTATETFKAHKSILSARSSVFKYMFTTDMREKSSERVNIEDLDADTVRQMLLYLYSDRLEDLEWEKAKRLYFAADKYNIIGLKYRCSSFLKNGLQQSNCCELLLLSVSHQDKELKKFVQEYIANYQDTILFTAEWKNLEKSNPELIIETFRVMCLGK